MSRDAFEATVKEVARQYQRWGMRNPEEAARRQMQPIAERADLAMENAPPPRKLDPNKDYTEPDKRIPVRVRLSDRESWELDRKYGFSQPRVGMASKPKGSKVHDPVMEGARALLERKHGKRR